MIFVFKTSVKSKTQAKRLKPHIDCILPAIKWNFDLEDCDNILRIDSKENVVLKIKQLLNEHNFYCEELD